MRGKFIYTHIHSKTASQPFEPADVRRRRLNKRLKGAEGFPLRGARRVPSYSFVKEEGQFVSSSSSSPLLLALSLSPAESEPAKKKYYRHRYGSNRPYLLSKYSLVNFNSLVRGTSARSCFSKYLSCPGGI